MYKKARYIVFVCHLSISTDMLFSLAAKVDAVAVTNHVAGAVKDKLLKELEAVQGRRILTTPILKMTWMRQ